MDTDIKEHPGDGDSNNEEKLMDRRGFLLGLKKWSKIVIGGALVGGAILSDPTEKEADAAGWINHRAGGGGGAWANRAGGGAAVGHGGAWANRAGGGGAWANRGAAWANRGGSWVNRF